MAYEKLNLKTGDVIKQSDLEHIEDGIVNVATIKGDKGDKGDTGAKGADGAKGDKGDTGPAGTNGTDGKDGFGTKAEYDALVARIEALEGA